MKAALIEISELLAADDRQIRIGEQELNSAVPDLVRLLNIQSDLRLAARALELLFEALQKHTAASERLRDEKATDNDRIRAFQSLGIIALDLELHIRQIYELLYAVQILAEGFVDQRLILAPSERQELGRLCRFRGSLLAHKDRVVRLTRGGRMWGLDGTDVRFGIALQPMDEGDAAHLQAVFRRARSGLPKDKQDEENWNEQLQLLYDNWPAVPKEDRGIVDGLLKRNGVKTDPPMVLAEMVLTLVRRFFPRQVEC